MATLLLFVTLSFYVDQAGFQFAATFLPLFPECWGCWSNSSHPVYFWLSEELSNSLIQLSAALTFLPRAHLSPNFSAYSPNLVIRGSFFSLFEAGFTVQVAVKHTIFLPLLEASATPGFCVLK